MSEIYHVDEELPLSVTGTTRGGLEMSLKTVVLFVDFSPSGEARSRYAVNLCLRHGAHLVGVYVAPSGSGGNRTGSYVRGEKAIRDMIERNSAAEAAASDAARKGFTAATQREDIGFDFRVVRETDADEQAKIHSLHADLIIVGHPRPGGLPVNWSPEDMLLETGVPLLIVPDEWNKETVAERVLLGWNASREARRAIADSLPLLAMAESVSVLLIDADKNPRHGEVPGADVAHYLSRHGARVIVEHAKSEGHSVAEVLQTKAEQNNIDLIVVGAYSHSRSRQTIFGGVTRALLANVKIPLLIAH